MEQIKVFCEVDEKASREASKISSRLFVGGPPGPEDNLDNFEDQQLNQQNSKNDKIQNQSNQTINLRIQDQQNGREYEGQAQVCADYLDKINHWITKKRFKCTQNQQDPDIVDLQIGQIFDFDLKRVEKNESDTIKQTMNELQIQRNEIDKELKLFNNYFFNHWKETQREVLRLRENGPIVNIDQLYWQLEGNGHIEQPKEVDVGVFNDNDKDTGLMQAMDDTSSNLFHSPAPQHCIGQNEKSKGPAKTQYFLLMKEPLSNELLNNKRNCRKLDCMINDGKSHTKTQISIGFANKTVSVATTNYFYPISHQVKQGQAYSLYIPK